MMKYEAPEQLLDLSQLDESQDTTVNGLQSFNISTQSRYSSAITYPREIMTMVWKRVKRSGHQASKYNFNILFKELIIDSERKPEKVQIAVMHRRQKYICEPRFLENSFSNKNKYMLIWPGFVADTIHLKTTLFKDPKKKQFDNKEWTLIAEEITKKGKTRPLAAVQLNFAFFVNQNPDVKTELKLKLRCLQKDVNNCTLSLILSSTLVKEGNAMDDDIQSHASVSSVKIPIDIPLLTEDNEKITEGVKRITKDFEDWKDEKEISIKPTPPPVIKQAWGEPAPTTATNEERRRHSRNDEPPPPLPPHRISTSRHSDSFEHDIIPSVSGHQHPTLPQHFPENFAVFEHDQSALSIQKNDESILDWCQRVAAGYLHVKSESLEESELNVSVTRKIVTNFEKSVAEIKDFKEEFQKIAERIQEIGNLCLYVEEKIESAEKNSEDEQKYVIEHMKLLNEKDALVRKQDYFNVAAEMSEVEEKLGIVQQQVNEVTTMNDTDKTEEEKQRIDDLVEEYKSLIDKKNELAETLIQKEAEEEEHDKFGRQTLERSQNFLRGSQEPLNTSQRFINWMKSKTI